MSPSRPRPPRIARDPAQARLRARSRGFEPTMHTGEVRGEVAIARRDPTILPLEQLHTLRIGGFMRGMTVRQRAEEARDTERTIGSEFTDIDRHWALAVRRSIAELREGLAEQADRRLALSADRWNDIAAGGRGRPAALAGGTAKLQGSPIALIATRRLFPE